MPIYTVPVTILASFDIEANDIAAAIEEARAFVDALEPSQPFIEGRNEVTSVHPMFPTRILDVSGFDCDRIDEAEVEEVTEDCETCASSIETRNMPCDECGHMDGEA